MYGTRDAALNCEETAVKWFEDMGFKRGLSNSGIFLHSMLLQHVSTKED